MRHCQKSYEALEWYLIYMNEVTPEGGRLVVTLMGRAMLLILYSLLLTLAFASADLRSVSSMIRDLHNNSIMYTLLST